MPEDRLLIEEVGTLDAIRPGSTKCDCPPVEAAGPTSIRVQLSTPTGLVRLQCVGCGQATPWRHPVPQPKLEQLLSADWNGGRRQREPIPERAAP